MMQNEHALYTNYLHAFSLKLYNIRSTWPWKVVQYNGWRIDEGLNPRTGDQQGDLRQNYFSEI